MKIFRCQQISNEIKNKITVWRKNAFSSSEIIQKLMKTQHLPENKAACAVNNVYAMTALLEIANYTAYSQTLTN